MIINHPQMHGKFTTAEKKATELSRIMPDRRMAVLAPGGKIKIYQNGKLVEERDGRP